jgi:hypothetical protein
MIYLYGLLEPGSEDPRAALESAEGVTGPITITDLGAALVVHGPSDSCEILPRRRHLLAHARVLEALSGAGAVLPMRFGMVGQDLGELAGILARQRAEIRAQFDVVRGCAEYGIRVTFPRPAALSALVAADAQLAAERGRIAAGRGARRMEAADFGRRLADRLDRRRALAQKEILAQLAGDLAAHVLRAPEEDVQVLALDALVRNGRAEALAARIEAAAHGTGFATDEEPEVRLIGPSPAYSFVRLTLDTDRRAA